MIKPFHLGFCVTSSLASVLLFARLARVMQWCLAKAVHPQGAASTQLGSLKKLREVLSFPKELLSLGTALGHEPVVLSTTREGQPAWSLFAPQGKYPWLPSAAWFLLDILQGFNLNNEGPQIRI